MSPYKRRLTIGAAWTTALLAILGWAAHAAVVTVDSRYVHTEAYAVDRSNDREHRVIDSLIIDRKFKETIDLLRRLDTTLRVCVRHQDTCR